MITCISPGILILISRYVDILSTISMLQARYVSDSVNRGTSTARRMHTSLYDWIVYQRTSKARERKGEE